MESQVKERLMAEFGDAADVEVVVDGNRALIRIVADAFANLSRVKRQQRVYGCIGDLIASGDLHAVTIQAATPEEAAQRDS